MTNGITFDDVDGTLDCSYILKQLKANVAKYYPDQSVTLSNCFNVTSGMEFHYLVKMSKSFDVVDISRYTENITDTILPYTKSRYWCSWNYVQNRETNIYDVLLCFSTWLYGDDSEQDKVLISEQNILKDAVEIASVLSKFANEPFKDRLINNIELIQTDPVAQLRFTMPWNAFGGVENINEILSFMDGITHTYTGRTYIGSQGKHNDSLILFFTLFKENNLE